MKNYTLFLDFSYRACHNPDEDYEETAMEEDVVEDITASIVLQRHDGYDEGEVPMGGSSEVKIGFLDLHYYNVVQANNRRFNIYRAFDRSGATIEMGDTIINERAGYLKDSIIDQLGETFQFNILIIQRFGIYPQYRGKGYGQEVIQMLKHAFSGKAGYIFLKCFPWQCEFATKKDPSKLVDEMQLILFEQDYKKAQAKLKKYYKSCGFVALKEDKDYFGYNLE